jgi:hypothetical protein
MPMTNPVELPPLPLADVVPPTRAAVEGLIVGLGIGLVSARGVDR